MLRILAVGNMYPPHHAGGYELMWQAAMRAARARGHEVRVLTSDHRENDDRPEDDPDVHRTLRWYWNLSAYEFPRLGVHERIALERHNAAELDRHLAAMDPDLVAWWSMGCMSLSLIERVRRAGRPAVSVVHDDWVVYGRQHDQWLRMWRGRRMLLAPLAERLLGLPTCVDLGGSGPFVFNSRYTRDQARQAGLSTMCEDVIHPGIDDKYLAAPASAPARSWRWRLACVGRIDRQKGIDTAVGALAHLPEAATLTVWGTGDQSYVQEMTDQARTLGLGDRVRFAGWADAGRLCEVYAGADAVLFPVRWEEPFGLVPIEAMAAGCPVVATARGGSAEFLRDGDNALIVPADDPAAMATALGRLAADPSLRARLREGGGATAGQHSIGRFATATVDAMERAAVLTPNPPAP